MNEMLLQALGIDKSKLPSADEIASVFAELKTIPERLAMIEAKLAALLNDTKEDETNV